MRSTTTHTTKRSTSIHTRTLRRLREEAPLYYNGEDDFFALSRFSDVSHGLVDHETVSSGHGAIVEWIKKGLAVPSSILSFEHPPLHNIHRNLLARMFTARKIIALGAKICEFCCRRLDPIAGTGHFDFVRDLGAQMPMQVIGMLLGIPDGDLEGIRDRSHNNMKTKFGQPMKLSAKGIGVGSYVRRLHRLARRASFKRPHDRTTQCRVQR